MIKHSSLLPNEHVRSARRKPTFLSRGLPSSLAPLVQVKISELEGALAAASDDAARARREVAAAAAREEELLAQTAK